MHRQLADSNPHDPLAPHTWPTYASLLESIWESQAYQCGETTVSQLVDDVTAYLLTSHQFGEARRLAETSWHARTVQLGEQHPCTITAAKRYAETLYRLGDHGGSRVVHEAMQRAHQMSGRRDEAELRMLGCAAAQDLRLQGQFAAEREERRGLYERACEVLGFEHTETLRLSYNFTGALRLTGEVEAARYLDEQNWRVNHARLGPGHRRTFSALSAFAMDLRECGQYPLACQRQKDGLAHQAALVGEDTVIGPGRNLAVATRRDGHYRDAVRLATRYLNLAFARYGRHSDYTASLLMDLAVSHRLLGEYTDARELAEYSVIAMAEYYGENHPFTLVSELHASAARRHFDPAVALAQDQDVLTTLSATMPPEHPYVLVATSNLAHDLAALGEHEMAAQHDRNVQTRATATLGPQHPTTLAAALNLAHDLETLGKRDEARSLQQRTLTMLRNVLRPGHPLCAHMPPRIDLDTDTMQF